MDQPTAPQLSLGMKPTVSSSATRARFGNSYGEVGQLQVLRTEKNDSAAGGLIQKNAPLEHNYLYNDLALAGSKQWLPLFHNLDIVTTKNATCEDTTVNDEFSVDSKHWQQLANVLDNDTTQDAFGCVWDF